MRGGCGVGCAVGLSASDSPVVPWAFLLSVPIRSPTSLLTSGLRLLRRLFRRLNIPPHIPCPLPFGALRSDLRLSCIGWWMALAAAWSTRGQRNPRNAEQTPLGAEKRATSYSSVSAWCGVAGDGGRVGGEFLGSVRGL
jgi:hypothetical protein